LQDINTRQPFKLGDDRLGNHLVHRAIQDNLSEVLPGIFPA